MDMTAMIRERALSWTPETTDSAEGQSALLEQLAAVVPPVAFCKNKWSATLSEGAVGAALPQPTLASIAQDVNKILGITKLENLKLEERSQEDLLKAWAAADVFCSWQNEGAIAELREKLTAILQGQMAAQQRQEETDRLVNLYEEREAAQESDPAFEGTTVLTLAPEMEETTVAELFPEDDGKTVVQPQEKVRKSNNLKHDPVSVGKGQRKKSALPVVLGVVAAAAVAVALAVLLNKAGRVERTISKIGEVSLSSGEVIAAAEADYAQLSESQQAKVDNYDVLTEARKQYDSLVVVEAIRAIGTVTPESEETIAAAEELYAALPQDVQTRVYNSGELITARQKINRQNKAIRDAIAAIDAIGTVTLDSGDKIAAARKAYDSLSKDGIQSYASGKASVLTNAEKAFAQCKGEELYNKAMELVNARKYEEALAQLQTVAKSYAQSSVAKDAGAAAAECQLKLAEACGNKGDLYGAMQWLKQVDSAYTGSENYTKQMDNLRTKLERSRPRNGNKFTDKAGWGWCELKITAGNEDLCVKVVSTEDASKYTLIYVRAGEESELNLKDGSYRIYVTSGENWYNKDVGFGDDATYQKASEILTLSSWRNGSYVYYYRYALNLRNSAASDFKLTGIDGVTFWGK